MTPDHAHSEQVTAEGLPAETGTIRATPYRGGFLRYLNRLGLCLWLVWLMARVFGGSPEGESFFKIVGLLTLAISGLDMCLANQRLRGTSLRPATLWAMLALVICLFAILVGDHSNAGRPWQGLLTHLAFLATLSALVSVLGARRPGENAWAVLCGLFLLIGLLPMFEGVSLSRKFDALDYLRFDSPWTYFIALVIFAGVSNYLPTRFFPASLVLGFGLAYHLRLLWRPVGRSEWRGEYWWFLIWCLCGTPIIGYFAATKHRNTLYNNTFHALWFPFRDAWGAAWALRVLERFNQSATSNKWPMRLHWFGLYTSEIANSATPAAIPDESSESPGEIPAESSAEMKSLAEKTLSIFIRRFGDLEQIRRL